MPTAYPNDTQGMPSSPRIKRSLGEDAVPAPSHESVNVPKDFRQVNGWGADLDPKNRPSFPKELPSDVMTARGNVGAKQVPRHRIHMSNEFPDLSPVFGESAPPKGLSGLLRDYAYQYGEATNRHWMTLIIADRIDMVESMVTSALRGKPDNIIAEKGWPARVRYASGDDRNRALMFAGATLGIIAVGALLRQARSGRY